MTSQCIKPTALKTFPKSNLFSTHTMEFDAIFKEIGEFGLYQKRNYFYILLAWIITGPIMVLPVFVMGFQNYRLDRGSIEFLFTVITKFLQRMYLLAKTNWQTEYILIFLNLIFPY